MMERLYNKVIVLEIIVILIGAVVIPSISGNNENITKQTTYEEPLNFFENNNYVNAYWKFDECSGNTAYDSSEHGYDGTIYGCTWTGGYSDCGLYFDGVDDYVDYDDYAKYYLGFNKSDDLIFSFYFKTSSTDNGIIYSSCRGDTYGYNPGFHIALNSDGKIQVQVWRLGCGILMNSTNTYNDDLWHFAEIFYKGDSENPTVDVYSDGTFDSSYEKYVCNFYSDQFSYAQIGTNSAESTDYFEGILDDFKIIKYPDGNGQLPPIIDGPQGGIPNVEYDYNFTIVDTEEDDCEINIDFNGYETGWLGPYGSGDVVTVSHEWDSEGDYYIRAKSRDIWGESNWSEKFPLVISENLPPYTPTVTGPLSGKPNIEYDFILNSVDPNGDDVKFFIDWGDEDSETTSFTTSGSDLIGLHSWSEIGTFIIRVKAQDIYGVESSWSELEISIPRTRASSYLWYEWFLERFPLLEKLLELIR